MTIFRSGYDSFASLREYLDSLPDQTEGKVNEHPYVEFFQSQIARPDDVKIAESHCATLMRFHLAKYLDNRHGRIYWRIRFETDFHDNWPMILRYDETGPDIDFLTNHKCFMDHNWKRVACYCRFYRAEKAANLRASHG